MGMSFFHDLMVWIISFDSNCPALLLSKNLFFLQLPMEPNHLGFHSPWAFIWYFFFLIAPLAYIYIALMLLRDLCEYFPETIQQPLTSYFPFLAKVTTMMKSYYGCRIVDMWCMIEAAFFIYSKVKIRYLQSKDPLEACLSAAPMLDSEERRSLWDRIMAVESDPSWLEEWFLDKPSIESITLYDIYDFVCWAMFDGRNQEHLTSDELNDLEGFVDDLEYRISLQLYGVAEEEESCDTSQISNSHRIHGEMDYVSPRAHGGSVTRNRTLSDAATASVVDNIDSFNYDLHSIDETKFSSPIKYTIHDSVVEGETPGSSKLGSWSSLPSVPRPRPKQCKFISLLCSILPLTRDFCKENFVKKKAKIQLISSLFLKSQYSNSEEISNVKGQTISPISTSLTK